MELKWLEDFLSLAETGNFSRSAQLRHITQPAFSRRIRALEAWLGLDLIDRTGYPVRLTSAGEVFRAHARGILAAVQVARAETRLSQPSDEEVLRLALPHTLSISFFPRWLARVESQLGPVHARLMSANLYELLSLFEEGGCDVLMIYDHSVHPLCLNAALYDCVQIGQEVLEPYSAVDEGGQPLFDFPGTAEKPVPYLAFSGSAYLRRVVEATLEDGPVSVFLQTRYEADIAEALKRMMLAGNGVAFLPASAVEREVAEGRAVAIGGGQWRQSLDICAFRKRGKQSLLVERIWNVIVSDAKEAAKRRA